MQKDFRADLARAGALHREGRLDQAIPLYRAVLRDAPASFEAARLLTLALLQSGRPKEAHAVARKARDSHKTNPHAQLIMGAVYQAEEKWDRALGAFEKSAELDPGLSEAHYLTANTLARLNRLEEAVARYDRVLEIDGVSVHALANRAVALSRLGRSDEALVDCDRLVKLEPRDPRHHLSRAGTLLELGRFTEAAEAADAALRLSPKLADAHFLKGQGLAGQANLTGARAAFAEAASLGPDVAQFQAALIRTDRQLGNRSAALAAAEKAVARLPDAAPIWRELAEVRRELKDPWGAREAAERALAAAPEDAAALTTKASLLLDADHPYEARALAEKALSIDPALPMARYIVACDDLAEGRWAAGWDGYEVRSSFLPPPYRPLPFARWDGSAAPDLLIVLGEQGIGDHIQYARLVRLLADRGIPTRLLVKPRLAPLLSRIDVRVPVITDLAGIDTGVPGVYWAPLSSLPRLVAPDPASWPRPPYLTAQPERIARWRGIVPDGFTVGIAWQGDPSPTVDIGRSVPLNVFAPLAALDGVELVSLQQGFGEEQLDACPFAGKIHRLGPDWDGDGAYLDTSALLQHLDLVVTTDTSLAHLAGARDRPAIVALKAVPEWRWGRSGQTTPLYPSLSLMRQDTSGDFTGLFARIAAMVAERRRGGRR